jgi:hypothetical protein
MFHGLINPCIHLIESHQLYIINMRISLVWQVVYFLIVGADVASPTINVFLICQFQLGIICQVILTRIQKEH